MPLRSILSLLLILAIRAGATRVDAEQPERSATTEHAMPDFGDWQGEVAIRPVLPDFPLHTLHTYFGISPESPNGQWVLLFTSRRDDAQVGNVVMVHRTSGEVRTLARAVEVEDAHRQANQQWVSGGKFVVHMELTDDQWQVVRTEVDGLRRTVLCTGRQLGWGQPNLNVVPLYGLHWNPGQHRDLELLDVRSGDIRTVLTAAQITETHQALIIDRLGPDRPISIFFPQLSPDGKRVFFKLATPDKGVFRSSADSDRQGLLVYDLESGRSLMAEQRWGHPAWRSDSRTIQNQKLVLDVETRRATEIPNLPGIRGSHASVNGDGSVFVTDIFNETYVEQPQRWAVLLADPMDGSHHRVLHVSPHTGNGTRSWRSAHPHPAFNAAGDRLYFNVMEDGRTVLHVAEVVAHQR